MNNGLRRLEVYCGDAAHKLSVDLYGSSLELDGGDMVVKGGLTQVLESLAEPFKDKIRLNCEVERIRYDGEGAEVEYCDEAGTTRSIRADYVVCTIPIGVLQERHLDLFHPNLPEDKVRRRYFFC